MLSRIFGTGEREAERYVTSIGSRQQIELGGLDGGEGRYGCVGRKGERGKKRMGGEREGIY